MKVPLDYAKPDGDTIELALIRAKAINQSKRIGSLIFNFGGPGSSGVATLPEFGTTYDKLRARYDLVSFDPRGVGRSDGVKCENDKQLDARFESDLTPDDAAEVQAYASEQKKYVAACKKNSGSELPYVGTTNAARDINLMHQVLGDEKLHYLGFSYGTELGASTPTCSRRVSAGWCSTRSSTRPRTPKSPPSARRRGSSWPWTTSPGTA